MSVAEIPPTSSVTPTAVQAWLAPQDTPLKEFCPAYGTLGADRRVHLVPCHTSARVELDTRRLYPPIAVQEFAAVHHTPCSESELPADVAGFGVAWTAQSVPFHASASVTVLNELLL